MNVLLGLARLIDRLNDRLGRLANWSVFLACLICAANALSRYAFDLSSNAWLEVQWYLFAAAVMLGASHTLRMNEHVRVDILYMHLSERGKAWLDLLGTAFFLLPSMATVAWLSWPIFRESWAIHEMSINAGGLLRWPVKLLLPLGFALVFLQGVAEIIKRAAVLRGEAASVARYARPVQ